MIPGPEARQATRPEPGAGPGAGAGLRDEVAEAANVLARLGLVTAYGHVSARAGESMLITPAADLACVTGSGVIEVPLAAGARPGGTLPAGAPAEAWAHLALYHARPDAAAIARAQPASAFAVAATVILARPAARPGRVAGRIGAGTRRRRVAQVTRAGRTGSRLPARRRGAAAARQRRPHPGRRTGPGGGPDVAARRRLRRLPDGPAASGANPVTPLSGEEIASWRAVGGELLPRLWQHLRRRSGAGFAGPDPGEVQG